MGLNHQLVFLVRGMVRGIDCLDKLHHLGANTNRRNLVATDFTQVVCQIICYCSFGLFPIPVIVANEGLKGSLTENVKILLVTSFRFREDTLLILTLPF